MAGGGSRRFPACLAILLLAIMAGGPFAAPVESAGAREYALKAAFLYNFVKFVEWPDRPTDSRTPIVIGVYGSDPFGSELQAAVQGRKINGHDLVVVHCSNAKAAGAAHVLFVNTDEGVSMGELQSVLSLGGVLTVGESELFSRGGGIITFRIRGDKLGFDINMATADRAGLRISAQLQKLATNVVRQP